jgi:hypothetical protein
MSGGWGARTELLREHRRAIQAFRQEVERLQRVFETRLLSNAERNIRTATESANLRAGDVRRRYSRALKCVYRSRDDVDFFSGELERVGEAPAATTSEEFEKAESNLRDHRIQWQLVLPLSHRLGEN